MMAIYRALLWLYPAAFRVQYAEELSSLFALRRRAASNFLALVPLWIETPIDILLTALSAHWDLLLQDLVYTKRTLLRSPGFTITAIAVAALGVGATTAAYTITDHALLRPLPFPQSERLVKLWEDMSPGGYNQMEPSPANYRDWKQMNRSFSAMAALNGYLSVSMIGAAQPQQVDGAAVTADLLPMLGAQAALGRIFTAVDDRPGASGTVVLSYALWQSEFAGDPNILGRRLLLDGQPFLVIGVMSRSFGYPRPDVKLWTTLRFVNSDFEDRTDNYLRVVAKLRPGVSMEQARLEMRLISDRLKREYPKENEHVGVNISLLRDEISDRSRVLLFVLLGAAFCVLLIACTNLANLLLARALERRKEVALRKALGAGRERLVRQMLTESLVLAFSGGLLGVLLAAISVPLLSKLIPSSLPVADASAIDVRVILFALLLTTLTGLCFGVLPSIRASSGAAVDGLQEGSRQGVGGRKERLRSALVISEIAISLVLLVSSGLLIRALWRLQQTNPGFRAENVLTMRTALPMPQYESTSRRVEFYTRVLSQVRALPGVSSAGYTSFLPIVAPGGIWAVTLAGQPKNYGRAFRQASLRFVTPGYFEAMTIPLLKGREILESDGGKSQYVAVVSESFARQYWPNEDPIGRQFDFGLATRTVMGVVGNVRVRGLERVSEPQVYLPYRQVPDGYLVGYTPKDLAVRSSVPGESLVPAIRRIIAGVDAQLPVSDVQMLTQILEDATAARSTQVRVLGGFALIAILLAGIGIHGLLSFAVANRSQEIGVRIAVGARPADILAMVLRDSVTLAAIGCVAGVALAYGAGRMLESILAGVQPGDLTTYAVGLTVALCMTLAGSLWPAARALRTDPMSAMRAE
jgi:predicted permease